MTCPKSQSESVETGIVSTLFSAVTPVPHTGLDKEARWGAQEMTVERIISRMKE